MSKEILEKQAQDDRYRRALGMLADMQHRSIEIECIERSKLDLVQEFDFFYQDFNNLLHNIAEQMEESDELLLNVSSGTPAMKSGLLVLRTIGEIPAKAIQVRTPERRMNVHEHSKEYDLEMLWELDDDNSDPFENRCEEVSCPTLSDLMKKEIIKKHVRVYDYRAALDVAGTLREPDEYVNSLLDMAYKRYLFDINYCLQKERPFRLPIRQEKYRDCFEYALMINIKLKRKEYGDFIRCITPLNTDLFELVLSTQCHIKANEFSKVTQNGSRKWDINKLAGTEVAKILQTNNRIWNGIANDYISTKHLRLLIKATSDNEELISLVEELRKIEGGDETKSGIRNMAAHEMLSVTNEIIKARTGYSGEEIMDMIKQLFDYIGIDIKPEYWNSYEKMNELIIDALDS